MAEFELRLEENIFDLHARLQSGSWKPNSYSVFFVQDPKLRKIHKASVRDRVLYQAMYQALYQVFDSGFIHDSYSSRNFKGTHAGFRRLQEFSRKLTNNYHLNGHVLKCDIRKFFDSIDHEILLGLIKRKIVDERLFDLIEKIVRSFETVRGKGLPLGNVTSQLFANIYLNELDQFTKHILKAKYYIRYCDDFVILDLSEEKLKLQKEKIRLFLGQNLLLSLHPSKVIIQKMLQGTDFLGYVALPYYSVLRTKTKRRMFGKLKEDPRPKLVQSYLGMLKHCRGWKIRKKILSLLS